MSGGGKARQGRFFEDFHLGQEMVHATPRTVGEGDPALYLALTGLRFLQHASDPFARRHGLRRAPLADWLAFHLVFGKTVPDISANATANLGYADGRFLGPVYPGDTLLVRSTVIGLKATSRGDAGIVHVRSRGRKSTGEPVLDYCRHVLVPKRDPASPPPPPVVPALPDHVPADRLVPPPGLVVRAIDPAETGSDAFLEDYAIGERIDHVDGMGVTESEHRLATRLYQNTARVHVDDHAQSRAALGRCLVYGGVVISIAHALSFNGLGNMLHVLALNAGRHVNPCVAGDTVYAWSEVLDRAMFAGRGDVGALRLRLVALRNLPAAGFPRLDRAGRHLDEVLLDLDYWALLPTRGTRIGT